MSSLSPEEKANDQFLKLVEQETFWRSIYACKGQYSDYVKKSEYFQKAMWCVQSMVNSFRDHSVSYELVVGIEENIDTFQAHKQLLKLECESDEIERLWKEASMKFKKVKDELQQCRCVLLRVTNKTSKQILQEGALDLLRRIDLTENMLINGKLTARECTSRKLIWKELEELPSLCEALYQLTESDVFWNLSIKNVMREFENQPHHSINTITDQCLSIEKNSIFVLSKFLKILKETGHCIYREKWRELIESDRFKIAEVLQMFPKTPDIQLEVTIARKTIPCEIGYSVESTLHRMYKIKEVNNTVDAVVTVMKVFGVVLDKSFSSAVLAFKYLKKGTRSSLDLTFVKAKHDLETIYRSVDGLSEVTIEIMLALGKSENLIRFLRNIVDEDIRNLIDAVEDISEQQVRETTVSALIEVRRYIQPILIPSKRLRFRALIQILEEQTQAIKETSKYLPGKILDCNNQVHSLKSLYNNVANRGEQTRVIIKSIIQTGQFAFKLENDRFSVVFDVSYTQHKNTEARKKTTLIDLRSRALLMKNSERTEKTGQIKQDDLTQFIEYIDLCLDISNSLYDLYSSGNFDFMDVNVIVKPRLLQQKNDELNSILLKWHENLRDARDKHFLLNFLNGTQIQILYKYLEGRDSDTVAVKTMLTFIHPDLQITDMKHIYANEKKELNDARNGTILLRMGCTLDRSFEKLCFYKRPITNDSSCLQTSLTGKVHIGRLLVAQLEEGSIYTVKTIIALYLNTTKMLPEPNQLLFCTKYTTWDEIELHIMRCLGAEQFYKSVPLFCIANVELLPNAVQFNLVDVLRNLKKEHKYLLALICRGSRNHPFIDELSEFVTSVAPASDVELKTIFHQHCSEVLTITSDSAGQGKSSLIRRLSHETGKGIVKLHISGPVRKNTLVERLLSLKIKGHHLLHIDIGSVDNPTALDTFLFELIVLRYVSSGRLSFSLCIKDVKIEIGNTISDSLRNSLETAVLFQRKHIEWRGISGIAISKEPESSVQVVCAYLKYIEEKTLDEVDLQNCKSDVPLTETQCRLLLSKYVDSDFFCSFPVLNTFLDVYADQLKKLTQSAFFKVKHLCDMVGSKSRNMVKSKLVIAMLGMAKEFARRSVACCRESQISTVTANLEKVRFQNKSGSFVEQEESMIRWEDTNHLIFVFHNQNIQTLSAIYRDLAKVENDVRFLFESQMKKKMEDYRCMDQMALQNMLQKVARSNPLPLEEEKLNLLSQEYALTADNLLKMVLIMMRIQANIPVVIMGETGCGKTSLVRYLAAICEVKFDVMNIHAGISEFDILKKVMSCNDEALKDLSTEHWLFLDEINTSENIGIIGDIICHHTCLGKNLAPNLIVMAACNPYRLRTTDAISTAGLDSKVKTDVLSRLVYRVLPLPEMVVDYVWDFGNLSERDEEKYILRMTCDVFVNDDKNHKLFARLLSASQAFVRKKESTAYAVSLRDIQRCKTLTKWFMTVLPKKKSLSNCSWNCDLHLKSIILSLAHCYHSRFADKVVRKEYISIISKILKDCVLSTDDYNHDFFLNIIKAEQTDILERMELPPGTACNSALQENVFIIFVCIFNRIPIFVVGKPGCSKSLAMQLIRSNLRGKDSKDEFFRTLPQLYCVSFQGSESSTSDGILKVFDKAEKYQESNSREDVLSVVILDEIGLAEISRFNPLKVLHNLLEPDGKSQPNVAVVGISNWALDASKMNRAIHLSRTDMNAEELFETALSISKSFLDAEKSETLSNKGNFVLPSDVVKNKLNDMANAYTTYMKKMRFKNFHGLRDYYSLVKFVARMFAEKESPIEEVELAECILLGLERNFGGLPEERQTLHKVFEKCVPETPSSRHSVISLITQNIQDPIARHLMVITTGESVLGIIETKLQSIGRKRKEIIYGSQFEEDLTDDYNYRILSKIILCMEEGIVLILKDLEIIYGSLYDMLNQNYTVIGKKKNCRVALGAYSNPICYVADSFKCIVLIEEKKLNLSDPPFLNRFEKQYLRFSDILGEKEIEVINKIEGWIKSLETVESPPIKREEMFPIYHEDMVVSLFLKHALDKHDLTFQKEKDDKEIQNECLKELLWVIKPEVVVRIGFSGKLKPEHPNNKIVFEYFSLPIHEGFDALLKYQTKESSSTNNVMCIVFTNSSVHTKVSEVTEETLQVEKLGTFKSEKQLSSRIQHFWDREDCFILVVQCNAKDDEKHIMLTKSVIERHRQDFMLRLNRQKKKHVYFIIHLNRTNGNSTCLPELNFLSDWQLITLDSILKPRIPLPKLYKLNLMGALTQKRPLHNCIKDELLWAFTRIKYSSQSRDVTSLSNVIDAISNSETNLEILDNEVFKWISINLTEEINKNWQLYVAKDKTLLNVSSGFVDALELFMLTTIKQTLCKFIYKMEILGITDCFFITTATDIVDDDNFELKRKSGLSLMHDKSVFSIDDVPDESGPECYRCDTIQLRLTMPFSRVLYDAVETAKEDFIEVYKEHCLLNEDYDSPKEIYKDVMMQQKQLILQKLSRLKKYIYKNWVTDYLEDFCNMMSLRICPSMHKKERIGYAKLIVKQCCNIVLDDPFTYIINLHSTWWTKEMTIRAEFLLIEACLVVFPDIKNEIHDILLPADKKASCNESPPSEVKLVTFLCKRMLPFDKCIKFHTDAESWVNKVVSALSLAYQVNSSPKILFSLRVCCELAVELVVPYKLEVPPLKHLGNLFLEEYPLDGDNVFEAIIGIINAAKEIPVENSISMRVLSSYFVMCIAADPKTEVLEKLFDSIKKKLIPEEMVHLFKPPLLQYFGLLEQEVFSHVLLCGLMKPDQKCSLKHSITSDIQQNRTLSLMDELIKRNYSGQVHSHSFIILIADIFQQFYSDVLGLEEDQFPFESSETTDEINRCSFFEDPRQVFYSSHKILTERLYGIQYVAAVAFIKAYVGILVEETDDINTEDFQNIMMTLDPVLSDESDKILVQIINDFFLKIFSKNKTLNRVKKITETHQDIAVFKKYTWTAGYTNLNLENSPLCIYVKHRTNTKYEDICRKSLEVSATINVITDLIKRDKQACLSMFSFAMREFYFIRYSQPIDDEKRHLAGDLCQKAKDKKLNSSVILFLCKVTGQENFKLEELNLSMEISNKQFCQASFCATWIANCLGSNMFESNSIFIRCFFAQKSEEKLYLPGFSNTEQEGDMQIPTDCSTDIYCSDCKCGNRYVCFESKPRFTCVSCTTDVKNWIQCHKASETSDKRSGIAEIITEQGLYGLQDLQPVTFHLLRLLTSASFIASSEGGMSCEGLEIVTKVPEIDVIPYLWSTYRSHWEHLLKLLNMDDYSLVMMLHVIVSHTKDLLFNTAVSNSWETVHAWEKQFENTFYTILATPYLHIKNTLISNDCLHGFKMSGLEQRLLEIDELLPYETKELLLTKQLFRINATPTKENFIAELYSRKKQFPCLIQIIENETKLTLPIHAINILNWHLATFSVANYVMKKNDCLTMNVQNFIYKKKDRTSQHSKALLTIFKEFQNSWRIIKGTLEDRELVSRMENIHLESKMSECMLLEENSILKEVLSALLSIQNEFLDCILRYANRSNALKFLFRDRYIAVIPAVHVSNMTKDDLISCNVDWYTLLSKESQCRLVYGQGKHIVYSFNDIEQAVVLSVVSGKSFIQIDDRLPKIVFMDEMHKNYPSMIRELRAIIPQKPLPQEIVHALKMKNDEDIRKASEIINYLGVVMTLLKKTKGDPNTPLIEYIESLKSLRNLAFPRNSILSSETNIKLCHLVSLSEQLEEMCVDTMKNALQNEFRTELGTHLREHLRNLTKDEAVSLIFLKALKRFTYRCVLLKTADPSQTLKRYLSEDSFWPLGCLSEGLIVINEKRFHLSDVIPDGMMVHHTYDCLSTMETELERRQMGKTSSYSNKRILIKPKSVGGKQRQAAAFRKF